MRSCRLPSSPVTTTQLMWSCGCSPIVGMDSTSESTQQIGRASRVVAIVGCITRVMQDMLVLLLSVGLGPAKLSGHIVKEY